MDPNDKDVNKDQGSSPTDQNTGVKPLTDSPPAQDVNAVPQTPPDSSTGEPPHEDSVPYDRFKQALDKAKTYEEEIEKLRSQIPQEPTQGPTPPKQLTPEETLNWFGIGPAQQPQGQQYQQTQSVGNLNINEEIEKRISEDLYTSPVKTLTPLIAEIASQIVAEQKKKETQVRAIPDFNKYESQYYSIPDILVNQVASNPETVRYLLAKHQSTISQEAPMAHRPGSIPSAGQPNLPPQNPTFQPGNGQQSPQNWDSMKAQLIEQGRQEVLKSLNQTQGVQAEGGQTIQTPTGENLELDEAGKAQMRALGIPESEWGRVAQRLKSSGMTY